MADEIVLYYNVISPPSRAVLVLLKELNLPFKTINVDLVGGEQFAPDFFKINPQHCVPMIKDGDFILWESRAILRYLVNKYAKDSMLYPTDNRQRAEVDKYLDFDLGKIFTAVSQFFVDQVFIQGKRHENTKLEKAISDALKILETMLGEKKYVTGNNVTIADISIASTIDELYLFDWDFTAVPNTEAYINNVKTAMPFLKECCAKTLEEGKPKFLSGEFKKCFEQTMARLQGQPK